MSVLDAIDTQPHEFDVHYHFTDFGLKPYYALDHVRKSHNWDGKPTAEITFEGVRWALCFDYDSQPLLPWSDGSYRLQSTPLFRLYFVAKDDTYDGERADHDKEHVFESGFSTGDNGTGFGLSIVSTIADVHDWSIKVAEGTEGGARFEFRDVEIEHRSSTV